MTIPSVPGVPFHRLARTEQHRWWRPVVGTLVLLVAGIVAIVVVYAAADLVAMAAGRPSGAGFGTVGDLGVDLLTLAVLIPCVLFTVWWVQSRPVGTVSSVLGRFRLRWLGRCLTGISRRTRRLRTRRGSSSSSTCRCCSPTPRSSRG